MSDNTEGWGPVPRGSIIAWNPEGETGPPDGWAVCDGTGGTPDLRERFILGTDKSSKEGKTGGNANHNHDGQTDQVDQKDRQKIYTTAPAIGAEHMMPVAGHAHTISEDTTLPPYMYLIYIMKQ